MTRPTIVTADDDTAVSAAITRDLTTQYGADIVFAFDELTTLTNTRGYS